MRIFIIGYMGCGKTTIGKKLAKKLQVDFFDLDDMITTQEGLSITTIFAEKGEQYFRALEHDVLKEKLQQNNFVLSCGGGTPCFFNNLALMQTAGTTLYLEMPPAALKSRLIKEKKTRPLINEIPNNQLEDFINARLTERLPYYTQAKIIYPALNIRIDNLVELIRHG